MPWNCPVFDSSGLVKDHRNSGSTLLASGTPSIASPVASAVASAASIGDYATLYWSMPHPTSVPAAFQARGLTEWPYDPLTTETPTLPSPWTSDETGFYFVEAGGTNSGNGDPTDPRGSFPTGISAGSVVVVSELGGSFSGTTGATYTGTSGNPIFVVARDPDNRPLFTGVQGWNDSEYVFVDGMQVAGNLDTAFSVTDSDFLTVRNCRIVDDNTGTGTIVGCGVGTSNLFFYDNDISGLDPADEGDFPTGAEDHHGFKLRGTNIWIFRNNFHHIAGNAVQIATQGDPNSVATNILIFGNTCSYTYQAALWTKASEDAFFCHNETYYSLDSGGVSSGYSQGGQYDFEWAWWIGNLIHDTGGGIGIASGNSTTSDNWYMIGNIIHTSTGLQFNPTSGGGEHGISETSGTNGTHGAIFNTIDNWPGCLSSRRTGMKAHGNYCGDPLAAEADVTKGQHIYAEASYEADYNYYHGSSFRSSGTITANTNSITGTDPGFVDQANHDYSLESDSDLKGEVPNSGFVKTVLDLYESRYGIDIRKNFVGEARSDPYNIGAY